MTNSARRRSFLGAVFGGGIATVAGCLENENADDDAGTDDEWPTGGSDDSGSTAGDARDDGSDGFGDGMGTGTMRVAPNVKAMREVWMATRRPPTMSTTPSR
ncbi:hypothetical protein [Natrarchaeobaculum aegyptiacum]|uniref:Uncharacterized protein n=1 Tax=Natrarchaeobaculum aegyptiacum TaxID=745377 RepID=A0A2Z2HZS4_9EURY|nr:hypothetical protein [Natrarchaeobaculum aegyptiacum]ARS91537.1 hypothetical protein B1756_18630 [Natrarchaeobaculum aegyptiacum]